MFLLFSVPGWLWRSSELLYWWSLESSRCCQLRPIWYVQPSVQTHGLHQSLFLWRLDVFSKSLDASVLLFGDYNLIKCDSLFYLFIFSGYGSCLNGTAFLTILKCNLQNKIDVHLIHVLRCRYLPVVLEFAKGWQNHLMFWPNNVLLFSQNQILFMAFRYFPTISETHFLLNAFGVGVLLLRPVHTCATVFVWIPTQRLRSWPRDLLTSRTAVLVDGKFLRMFQTENLFLKKQA